MSWQEEEIEKRLRASEISAENQNKTNYIKCKLAEFWDKLILENSKLSPEIRLNTSGPGNLSDSKDYNGGIYNGRGEGLYFFDTEIGNFTYSSSYKGGNVEYTQERVNNNHGSNYTIRRGPVTSGSAPSFQIAYNSGGLYATSDVCIFDKNNALIDAKRIGYVIDENSIDIILRNLCTNKTLSTGLSVSSESNLFNTKCFIATAAYGTPLAFEVILLQGIRDRHLKKNHVGNAFIEFYYYVSPPIAKAISRSGALRAITRFLLNPIIQIAKYYEQYSNRNNE